MPMGKPTDMLKRNYQLPRRLAEWLDDQQKNGLSMQGAVRWALYWYINRLSPDEQAQAQRETQVWLKTGKVPPSSIADEADEALSASREQESGPSDHRSTGTEGGQ